VIRFYVIFFFLFSVQHLLAQAGHDSSATTPIDTLRPAQAPVISQTDSLVKPAIADSILVVPAMDSGWRTQLRIREGKSFRELVYKEHPFFAFGSNAFIADSDIRQFPGKELLFYALIALFLIFAFLRTIFSKYLNDLFRLFFRRTLKQRQITEQLSQTPLPSLVFNIFFMVTAGLYLGFIFQHYGLRNQVNFWLLSLYCSIALGAMYLIKFLTLKFTGWVLNVSTATESYIFIVFIINKVIGIFLLPFLVLMAFSDGFLYQLAITLSWCGIGGLVLYRFILSYSAVHNQIKVKPFHFVIYLLAFEIVPLLLIYKLLLYFLF